MNFEDILVLDVFFVPDFFGNGDPTLYTYSDDMLGHRCSWIERLYGFLLQLLLFVLQSF
jgi:hypothetical protein